MYYNQNTTYNKMLNKEDEFIRNIWNTGRTTADTRR